MISAHSVQLVQKVYTFLQDWARLNGICVSEESFAAETKRNEMKRDNSASWFPRGRNVVLTDAQDPPSLGTVSALKHLNQC
jgi:hypothetical protein